MIAWTVLSLDVDLDHYFEENHTCSFLMISAACKKVNTLNSVSVLH